ncbi:DNRLRE domain-containing protein [Blastococcus sp. TF02-09]|uniref:DNRLRE domain-containing protein n=1 Tax=Blastococcus sp. TF02-09 TaxID=2250576 RepID=UPI001314F08E|nr:DNRLRE domain-containing protein [Blastococcus sp. TF02-9]
MDVAIAPPAAAAPKPIDERPEAVRAQEKAKAGGKPVEILERRTDRSTTFANPDGTTTDEISSSPVRVHRGGVWQDIDLTLGRQGNRLAPAVSPADVSFSSGGRDRDLVQLRIGQRRVTVAWPSKLPAATVSGGVATYRGVAPGTDLELAATASGYEKYLRLREIPADPEYRFTYRLSGVELRKDEAGMLVLVDRRDRVVARVPAPRMWDASVDPASGEPRRSADVATEVRQVPGGAELVLKPDTGWLRDSSTKYPVTVDPGVTLGGTADTWVQEGFSSSQYSNAQLRVGTYDGATVARSMLRFDVAAYSGRHITAATLRLYNVWSYSCNAAGVNAHPLTAGFGTTTNWATQPAHTTSGTWAGSGSFSFGHSNCADGWGTVNVQKMVDGWTRGGLANHGMIIRASETSASGWKKFCSGNPSAAADMAPCSSAALTPKLAITYNTIATAPGALSATPCRYICGTPAAVNPTNLIPTLTAQSSDRDGNGLRYDFEIWSGRTTRVAYGSPATATQNTKVAWRPSVAVAENAAYEYRVRAWDGTDFSPWSSWFGFKQDRSAPAAPTVTSTSHPNQSAWSRSTGLAAAWAAPGDASGIQGYAVVRDRSSTTVPATTTPLQTTASWNGTAADGVTFLHVRAVDKAGNWGATAHYRFQVDTAPPTLTVASSSHPDPAQWYGADLNATLTPNADTSGVARYVVVVDDKPTTAPTGDGQTSSTVRATKGNGAWFLHVKAVDRAGNVGPTVHRAFNVDGQAPAAPVMSSSTHPDPASAYPGTEVRASWTAPSSTSPVVGYAVLLNETADSVPGPTVTQTATTFTGTTVDGVHWLHVRALDRAGNWGPATHRKIHVDTSLRAGPAITSTSHPDQAVWTEINQATATWAPAQGKDVVGYAVSLDGMAEGAPAEEPTQTEAAWSGSLPGDGAHYLHVRTCFTDGGCSVTSTYGLRVDRDAPTGAISAPVEWAETSGVVRVSAEPEDAGSGVARVDVSTLRQGVRTPVAADTLGADGWSVNLDTRNAEDGPLTVLVTYTDAVGHVRTDAAELGIVVDNAEASPEDWEETVGIDGLAVDGATDAQVALGTGTLVVAARDAEQPGTGFDAVFERVYSSSSTTRSSLGLGWRGTYDDTLIEDRNGDVTHLDAAGREHVFVRAADGGYVSPDGVTDTLEAVDGGGWLVHDEADNVSRYDAAGRRLSVTDEAGNVLTVARNEQSQVTAVCVGAETCTAAEAKLSLAYSGGKLTAVTAPGDRTWTYAYDLSGRLATVAGPRPGVARQYVYDDDTDRLIGVTDAANGVSRIVYDRAGRVEKVYDAKAIAAQKDAPTSFGYTGDPATTVVVRTPQDHAVSPVGPGETFVLDPAGAMTEYRDDTGDVTTYSYDEDHNVTREDGPATAPTTATYNADGNIIRDVDEAGQVTTYEYDADGNVSRLCEQGTPCLTYTFDAEGNVVKTVDDLGHTETATYDAAGQVTSETDELGQTVHYTYDADGNLVSEEDPFGATTTFAYDEAGNLVQETDPMGRSTDYDHDAEGNVVTVQAPPETPGGARPTTTYAYDGAGNVIAETSPQGNVDGVTAAAHTTTYEYDELGNLESVGEPLGGVEQTRYDLDGNAVAVVDELGKTTTFEYDADGQLRSETSPDGSTLTAAYDSEGQVTVLEDAAGKESFDYDAAGQLIGQTDANGGTTEVSYNLDGSVAAVTSASSNEADAAGDSFTTSYTYDDAGQLVAETTPEGRTVEHVYDAAGNEIATTDPSGNTTRIDYDALGRPVRRTLPGTEPGSVSGVVTGTGKSVVHQLPITVGGVVSAVVDWEDSSADLDLVLKDPSGAVVSEATGPARPAVLVHDVPSAGTWTLEVRSVTGASAYQLDHSVPVLRTETVQYDASGAISAFTDVDGTLTMQYEGDGDTAGYTLPDGSQSLLADDVGGQVTAVQDPTGTQTFGYDAEGQVVTAVDQANVVSSFTYDAAGNEVAVDRDGDTTTFTYDEAGDLASQMVSGASKPTTIASSDKLNPTDLYHATGEHDQRRFDAEGQVTAVRLRPQIDAAPSLDWELGYDADGNLTSVSDALAGHTLAGYRYDEDLRLVEEVRRGADGDDRMRTFTYDPQGNMLAIDGSGRPVRQSFNQAGQLVRRTVGSGAEVEHTAFVYDKAGNLIRLISPDGLTTYSWTADGRLAAMSRPDGVRVEFVYDGTGKRQTKTVHSPDGSVSTTRYSWDAGRLATVDRDGMVAKFGYDPAGAPLSLQMAEAVYAFRTDVRGSTLELTDTATHEPARVLPV